MRLDPVHTIPVGAPIYTEDGEQIGHVREVDGAFLKVDVALQPDYWLPTSAVLSYTAERVTLAFKRDELGDRKLARPEP